jgi:hypothetical protein
MVAGWPQALIGVPTGCGSGTVILDIDVKYSEANGFDSLVDLGYAILPDTRMCHTGWGGSHLHFDPLEHEIPCTEGARGRGIGPGLDWRGEGGYVILPSPGSGYWWDPHHGLDKLPAPVPTALLPRKSERPRVERLVRPETGLSPYAEAALRSTCQNITYAAEGAQESTVHSEVFSIGTLAASGGISANFARSEWRWAARQIRDYDPKRPWTASVIDRKVDRAFRSGMEHPR